MYIHGFTTHTISMYADIDRVCGLYNIIIRNADMFMYVQCICIPANLICDTISLDFRTFLCYGL